MLEAMELHPVTLHGQTARRTVSHFGLDYGYESWTLEPTARCRTTWHSCRSGPRP